MISYQNDQSFNMLIEDQDNDSDYYQEEIDHNSLKISQLRINTHDSKDTCELNLDSIDMRISTDKQSVSITNPEVSSATLNKAKPTSLFQKILHEVSSEFDLSNSL